ncbi:MULTISPECIES: ATP-grasp domain-containing protein [unclassified Streptomyces]|uniref:ATP-grasp domain-containing protein n=1 Tax=unclassified Streptomyces TaxID=2593676 RepID=UPI0024BB1048|nr:MULTISPECIES: ATP-grasp domain-containing protein [unclassified Streptomyces]MDJ0346292.1 ATP-grasp domain-containing protein [Streptomyces sp. PH10-H1]
MLWLENKIEAREWLRSIGMPVPVSATVATAGLRYKRLSRLLGLQFVVQTPVGSGGAGTFLIRREEDIDAAVARYPGNGRWLVSSYAGETTMNHHGLVSPQGEVTVTAPSIQLANLPQAGSRFGEYAGSDFALADALPARVLQSGRSLTARLGERLAKLGHRGIFGIDFAVNEQEVTILEINPRVQASTWLLGELEREAGQLPTLCRHVTGARLGPSAEHISAGVQLVVRHTGPPHRVSHPPRPGVYSLADDGARYVRAGIGLADCHAGEFTVNDVPRPGTVVLPGAAIGRLAGRATLTTPQGQCLTRSGIALIKAFRSLFADRDYAASQRLEERP